MATKVLFVTATILCAITWDSKKVIFWQKSLKFVVAEICRVLTSIHVFRKNWLRLINWAEWLVTSYRTKSVMLNYKAKVRFVAPIESNRNTPTSNLSMEFCSILEGKYLCSKLEYIYLRPGFMRNYYYCVLLTIRLQRCVLKIPSWLFVLRIPS